MASKEASQLSAAEHDELCCSYAALMLHDDGLEITVSITQLLIFYIWLWFNLMLHDLVWKTFRRHHCLRKQGRAILANALR